MHANRAIGKEELDRIKRQVDLRRYAESLGYHLDEKASSKNSFTLRTSWDKIIVKRNPDGIWVYFSVHNDTDSGTVLDFVQNRRNITLGAARRELRPWIGAEPLPTPEPTGELRHIRLALAGMDICTRHPYLDARGIPHALLRSPRFYGKVLRDRRGNVVFPHVDRHGHCGYEIKNRNFTGYAKDARKGLWLSAVNRRDTALAFAESAIDALSYALLHPAKHIRYASIAGAISPVQRELITAAAKRVAQIIIAVDNDEGGKKITERIETLAAPLEKRVVLEIPVNSKDWNEELLKARESA